MVEVAVVVGVELHYFHLVGHHLHFLELELFVPVQSTLFTQRDGNG